ncbi:MAG: hypothetical protein CFE21_01195 [Bacteroidetes bacterium B1(2017)]|nr:MAG: hypothetical protein CFE21_01195 [Bacteroidetes bacterium B1(2017)]
MLTNTKKIQIGSAVLFAITCWFSLGFRHGDEHYQIFEFARYFAGLNTSMAMAWEFVTQMRPAIQPLLTFLGIKFLDGIGFSDPFFQAFCFRLVSAGLLFYSINIFVKKDSELGSTYLLFFMLFFCLTPYIGARYSSEGMAVPFFVLMIAKSRELKGSKDFLVLGLLAGLTFAFRYQMAFALIGLGVWYLLNRGFKMKEIGMILLGFFSVFIGSTLLDRLFYGNWVCAPFNYFYQNIVLNKASNYGVDPWYAYFLKLLKEGFWLPGLFVLLSFCYYTFKRPKDILTLSVWFFLIGHMLVAHKEARFMLPIVPLIPYFVWFAIQDIRPKQVQKVALFIMLCANFILLWPASFLPASQEMAILKYLEQVYEPNEFTLFYKDENNPYNDYALRNNFYGRKFPKEFSQDSISPNSIEVPAVWISYSCNEDGKEIGAYKLRKIKQSWPEFVTNHFNFNNWTSRTSILTLYSLEEK